MVMISKDVYQQLVVIRIKVIEICCEMSEANMQKSKTPF